MAVIKMSGGRFMVQCCLEPDCSNLGSLALCTAFSWLAGNVLAHGQH